MEVIINGKSGQADHRRLPAICLAGIVGLYHRRAAWPTGEASAEAQKGRLAAWGLPAFEELARDADLGLFRSISSN